MALKRSSEIITISGQVDNSTSGFAVTPEDLQLNPLDQEVFVVLGVAVDFTGPLPVATAMPLSSLRTVNFPIGFTSSRPATQPTLANNNCFAYAERSVLIQSDAAGDFIMYNLQETAATDSVDTNLDYIAIIATSNYFVSSTDETNLVNPLTASYKIFGYRAKADAATYAALVQSEVLSA